MVAGMGLSAVGTVTQMQQQQDIADFQAAQLENEAEQERQAAQLREEDRRERLIRSIAEQRVAFGASGREIDPNVLATTQGEFAKEQFNDDFNVARRVQSLTTSAQSARLTGQNQATSTLFDFFGNTTNTLVNRAG